MTNAAISAQGSVLGVTATTPPTTYTTINQLTDFVVGTGKATRLDASNLASTQKEYIAGLLDHGELTLKGQWVDADAGQALLKSNAGNGTLLHFQSTFPDGHTATWDAEVAEFQVTSGTDKVLDFTAIIWPRNFVWGA